jgi:DinB superfamily
MSDSSPTTTAELLSLVDRAWLALESTVARLKPAQLSDIRDPAGWAVKDHLMHIAVWEDYLLARLTGRSVSKALGLDEATLAGDEDTQNAAIFAQHRHRPLTEVLDTVRASHRATRARLATLADHAVEGSVSDVVPPGAERDERPAAAWIGGNTWEHYTSHLGWIRELVDRG